MEKWFFSKWVFLVFLKKGAFFWEGGFFQNLEVFFKIFKKVWFKSRLKRIKSNLMGAFERAHRERSETHLHGVSLIFSAAKKLWPVAKWPVFEGQNLGGFFVFSTV